MNMFHKIPDGKNLLRQVQYGLVTLLSSQIFHKGVFRIFCKNS